MGVQSAEIGLASAMLYKDLVDAYESYLLGQVAANPNFSTKPAVDPNTQLQFYTSAPGLALEVANQAIDSSTQIWPTTVARGPVVPIQRYGGKPIPAICAQGYRGNDGSHYHRGHQQVLHHLQHDDTGQMGST